jgi:hypothetical protein
VTRRCVALAAVALLVAHASGAQPPCRTRVLVEPDTAFVGQQITYRLQIFRHIDVSSVRFTRDLGFPSFRAEWLPGQSPDPAIADVGDHALVFEERRALFPTRAGELAIPAARLECVSEMQTIEVDVPAARVLVREAPEAERPPGFRGVVGRVDVQAHLSSERVALGQSLTLVVTVRGAANAWDAADPFDPARDLAGVDVYAHPPTTERETGRHLEVRRAFSFDLVPRSVGSFEIPALRVPYFDPERERYEVAETAALPFTVETAASEAVRPVAPAATASPRSNGPRGNFGTAVVIALVVSSLFGVAVATLRRRVRQRAALRAAEPLLADAATASARGDPLAAARALAAALRAALETRVPGAGALAAEEIAARDQASLRAVGEALLELDQVRFGAAPGRSCALDAEQVRALIASL